MSWMTVFLIAVCMGGLIGLSLRRLRGGGTNRSFGRREDGPSPAVHASLMKAKGPGPLRATLSIPDFFDDNTDPDSFAVNVFPKQPSLTMCRTALEALKQADEIDDIRMGITDYGPHVIWPFSDRIFVSTTLELSEIETSLEALHHSGGYKPTLLEVKAYGLQPSPPNHWFVLTWD